MSERVLTQSADSRRVLMEFAAAYDAAPADADITIHCAESEIGEPAVIIVIDSLPFGFTVPQALALADATEAQIRKGGSNYLADLVMGLRHAAGRAALQMREGEGG